MSSLRSAIKSRMGAAEMVSLVGSRVRFNKYPQKPTPTLPYVVYNIPSDEYTPSAAGVQPNARTADVSFTVVAQDAEQGEPVVELIKQLWLPFYGGIGYDGGYLYVAGVSSSPDNEQYDPFDDGENGLYEFTVNMTVEYDTGAVSGSIGQTGIGPPPGWTGVGGVGATGPQGVPGVQGSTGPQGAPGIDGATGPQGVPGVQGSTGPQGAPGIDGATGPQGIPGIQGSTGPQGMPGIQGQTGVQGVPGLNGTTGPQGIPGIQGSTGPQGVPGLNGLTGPQGVPGVQGSTGPQGVPGVQGATGLQGGPGVQGSTGPQGVPGIQGSTGPQGVPGLNGTTGPQGIPGIQGSTGPQGVPGLNGLTGPQGVPGIQGNTGPQGAPGVQGSTGPQGIPGVQGQTGVQGIQGITGLRGLTGPQGATGIQGVTGLRGMTGIQGATGIQGMTGAQGATGLTPPVGGANTQVLYNNSGVIAGANGFYVSSPGTNSFRVVAPAFDVDINTSGLGYFNIRHRYTSARYRAWTNRDHAGNVKSGTLAPDCAPFGSLARVRAGGRLILCGASDTEFDPRADFADATANGDFALRYVPFDDEVVSLYNATIADFEQVPIDSSASATNISIGSTYPTDIYLRANGQNTDGSVKLQIYPVSWGGSTRTTYPLKRLGSYIYGDGLGYTFRYVGTIFRSSGGVVGDNPANRSLWNAHNQIQRGLYWANPSTGTTTYAIAASNVFQSRYFGNQSGPHVKFGTGMAGVECHFTANAMLRASTDGVAYLGLGLDSGTTAWTGFFGGSGNLDVQALSVVGKPSVDAMGAHSVSVLEGAFGNSGGSQTSWLNPLVLSGWVMG